MGQAMSELDREFIMGVRNANAIATDAEDRALRWTQRRGNMTRIAHEHGLSVETIAAAVGQPTSTIHEWLNAPAEESP